LHQLPHNNLVAQKPLPAFNIFTFFMVLAPNWMTNRLVPAYSPDPRPPSSFSLSVYIYFLGRVRVVPQKEIHPCPKFVLVFNSSGKLSPSLMEINSPPVEPFYAVFL